MKPFILVFHLDHQKKYTMFLGLCLCGSQESLFFPPFFESSLNSKQRMQCVPGQPSRDQLSTLLSEKAFGLFTMSVFLNFCPVMVELSTWNFGYKFFNIRYLQINQIYFSIDFTIKQDKNSPKLTLCFQAFPGLFTIDFLSTMVEILPLLVWSQFNYFYFYHIEIYQKIKSTNYCFFCKCLCQFLKLTKYSYFSVYLVCKRIGSD